RYGEPSIADQLAQLQHDGATKIAILPLYPQYASSTTGSSFDAVASYARRARWVPELRFIANYHDRPAYINACAAQIRRHWDAHGRADKLLYSFHGLPKFHLDKGDPYYCHCHKTVRLINQALELDPADTLTTFQSRFGRTEWLRPYTDETLKALPGQGCTSVDVFCPGFAADCLETLEEIAVENKNYFIEAGGEQYRYIAALNSSDEHIAALTDLLNANLQDWLQLPARNSALCQQQAQQAKDNYPAA
ncbi:MAG: ferrochelatase, partial [Gammaproteobacteria bacterium]|nr:ferrochelatase [Gammaproteobacteria bacterium]